MGATAITVMSNFHLSPFCPRLLLSLACVRLERFSNDCRETNSKLITPTYHHGSKQRDEVIRIPCRFPVTCSKREKNSRLVDSRAVFK